MKSLAIPVLLMLCLIPGVLGSLSDGLVLNYTMHSDTNPVCVDYSAYGNNGTVTSINPFGIYYIFQAKPEKLECPLTTFAGDTNA